ncbi:MAG: hypothetical protein ABR536_07365 [Solirubrobacterales bacterium]
MSRVRGSGVVFAFLGLLAVAAFTGCGRDDFNNDPKPPVPLEATIEISPAKVEISPSGFGAGLVNFVIANNSGADAALAIKGPVDETSSPIPSNGNGIIKVAMKTGEYEIGVDGQERIKPTRINVGPDREASNNDLLLP